jgi:hypothetical protein
LPPLRKGNHPEVHFGSITQKRWIARAGILLGAAEKVPQQSQLSLRITIFTAIFVEVRPPKENDLDARDISRSKCAESGARVNSPGG